MKSGVANPGWVFSNTLNFGLDFSLQNNRLRGSTAGDHIPVAYILTIEKHYYLCPTAQGQIDGISMSEEEKVAP